MWNGDEICATTTRHINIPIPDSLSTTWLIASMQIQAIMCASRPAPGWLMRLSRVILTSQLMDLKCNVTSAINSRPAIRTTDEFDSLPKTSLDATLRSYDRGHRQPTFGAWLDHARQDKLQREYTGLYVRKTYTLFMYRALHS